MKRLTFTQPQAPLASQPRRDEVCEPSAKPYGEPEQLSAWELLESIRGIGEDAEASGRDHDRWLYGPSRA